MRAPSGLLDMQYSEPEREHRIEAGYDSRECQDHRVILLTSHDMGSRDKSRIIIIGVHNSYSVLEQRKMLSFLHLWFTFLQNPRMAMVTASTSLPPLRPLPPTSQGGSTACQSAQRMLRHDVPPHMTNPQERSPLIPQPQGPSESGFVSGDRRTARLEQRHGPAWIGRGGHNQSPTQRVNGVSTVKESMQSGIQRVGLSSVPPLGAYLPAPAPTSYRLAICAR